MATPTADPPTRPLTPWCAATSFLALLAALLGVALSITGMAIAASRPPAPAPIPNLMGLDTLILVLVCAALIAAAVAFAQTLIRRPLLGFWRVAASPPSTNVGLGLPMSIVLTVLCVGLCAYSLVLTAQAVALPPSPYVRNPFSSVPLTLGITAQALTSLSFQLFNRWWHSPRGVPPTPSLAPAM